MSVLLMFFSPAFQEAGSEEVSSISERRQAAISPAEALADADI